MAARYVRALHKLLSAVLGYSVRHSWLLGNVALGVDLPALPTDEKRVFLTHAEVARLANAAVEVSGRGQDGVLVRLLAYAGLRVGEATALQRPHVDFKSNRISVVQGWTEDHHVPVLGSPKGNRSRTVPIPPSVRDDLIALALSNEVGGFLFTSPRGEPVNLHNWRSRVWTPALAAADIDRARIHDLRHTAASLAIAANAKPVEVKTMLGHSSINITIDTYTHLFPDDLDEVAERMEAARVAAVAL